MAISPSIAILMLGRFVAGLGIGVASQIVNIYLSELAPK
jgi:predicted MFS family arabinose efflux permease